MWKYGYFRTVRGGDWVSGQDVADNRIASWIEGWAEDEIELLVDLPNLKMARDRDDDDIYILWKEQ